MVPLYDESRRSSSGITGRRDSVWFVAFTEQPTWKLLTLSGSVVSSCVRSPRTRGVVLKSKAKLCWRTWPKLRIAHHGTDEGLLQVGKGLQWLSSSELTA